MTTLLLRFQAPLRGFKAINVTVEPGDTADAVATRALMRVGALYGFGMRFGFWDGLQCIGMTDGRRTIGWGGLLKGGRKLQVSG